MPEDGEDGATDWREVVTPSKALACLMSNRRFSSFLTERKTIISTPLVRTEAAMQCGLTLFKHIVL